MKYTVNKKAIGMQVSLNVSGLPKYVTFEEKMDQKLLKQLYEIGLTDLVNGDNNKE